MTEIFHMTAIFSLLEAVSIANVQVVVTSSVILTLLLPRILFWYLTSKLYRCSICYFHGHELDFMIRPRWGGAYFLRDGHSGIYFSHLKACIRPKVTFLRDALSEVTTDDALDAGVDVRAGNITIATAASIL